MELKRKEKMKLLFPFLGPKEERLRRDELLRPLPGPPVTFPKIKLQSTDTIVLDSEQLPSRIILVTVQMRSWWHCKD